jgi:hypothetical protein
LGLTISLKIGKTFPHLWKNVKELYTPSNTQQISPGYWILAYWCTLKSSKMQKCFGYSDTGNRNGRTLGVIPWYPVPGRCEAENDSFWSMQQGGPSPPTKVFAQAPAGYLLSLSAGSLEPGTTMHNYAQLAHCFDLFCVLNLATWNFTYFIIFLHISTCVLSDFENSPFHFAWVYISVCFLSPYAFT